MKNVKGTGGVYDWGDHWHTNCNHGSIQVHVVDLSTTVFVFNKCNRKESPDIGIGNANVPHTDLTFSQTEKTCNQEA